MSSKVTIRDIKVYIMKLPGEEGKPNPNITAVKIETSEPGLYGLGCATFAYRDLAVKCVIENYIRPILIGRDVSEIEDIWHLLQYSAYWRTGPIEMNAISGIDIALWDIKGKMAGMPVYDLLGGKCHDIIPVYQYADGNTTEEVCENVQKRLDEGNTHIRVRINGFGGIESTSKMYRPGTDGVHYDPVKYMLQLIDCVKTVREQFGYHIEILHDVHERIDPQDALWLAKELEPYRLFFLEDLFAPEQCEWYKLMRQQVFTPVAVGELFTNSKEWDYLVTNRLVDYLRNHITSIGGITPSVKLMHQADMYGIKIAWHGPPDITPIGHAANIHMDYACHNLGIQEWAGVPEAAYEVFPGCPYVKGNAVYLNEKPGLGVDFDEGKAKMYPPDETSWLNRWQWRTPNGTLHTP